MPREQRVQRPPGPLYSGSYGVRAVVPVVSVLNGVFALVYVPVKIHRTDTVLVENGLVCVPDLEEHIPETVGAAGSHGMQQMSAVSLSAVMQGHLGRAHVSPDTQPLIMDNICQPLVLPERMFLRQIRVDREALSRKRDR